jgi:transcriptional regulator with XRE-family HTH domain
MKYNPEEIMTPDQCRAARAFLNWSQEFLAEKARVIKATIGDYERRKTTPYKKTLEDIRTAFEKAGIRFENNDVKYSVDLLKGK